MSHGHLFKLLLRTIEPPAYSMSAQKLSSLKNLPKNSHNFADNQMSSQGKRWAILIGVNFYPGAQQRLEGAVNDVDDIHSYLERYYGPITTFKITADAPGNPSQTTPKGSPSSWPTYTNVIDAITKVTQSADSGDLVYLHYSGHGTLKPTAAQGYRNDDGSDAALVLLNPGIGHDVRYLRGIDLASLFDTMMAKGISLVVTLDCCHSGAVTRGEKSRIRGVPWDYHTDALFPPEQTYRPTPRPGNRGCRSASVERHWLVKPDQYTLFAACGSNEIARECEGKDGRPHGALSYFLFQALSFASRNRQVINLGNMYDYICARLHVPLPHQHPKLLGTRDAAFMGTTTTETSPNISVLSTLSDQKVILDIGLVHGASAGDEYALSPAAWMDPKPANQRQEIICRITSALALQSEAEIQGRYHIRKAQSGWHATLHRHSNPKALVFLYPGVDPAWKKTIDQSSWLQTTNQIAVTAALPSFQAQSTTDGNFEILDAMSNPMPHVPTVPMASTNALHLILVILEHLVKFSNIEALGNQWCMNLRPGNNERMTDIHAGDLSDKDFNIELTPVDGALNNIGNTLVVQNGAKVAVKFSNHTEKPLYLTVLNLQPLRRIAKIYPSRDGGNSREINRKDHNFKGNISFKMKMSVPETVMAAGGTQSEDVLKFIVTTEPKSFQAFELPELSAERLSEAKRDQGNSLLSLLLDFNEPGKCARRQRSGERKVQIAFQNFTVRTLVS
jgi:hypothetical protein